MVGIYPGTFDPVHNGHVSFCRAAMERSGLERVILLPERQPRDKQGVTHFADRVAMLKLAVKDVSNLEVVTLDDEQFTVQATLPKLQQMFGQKLALLVGSDVVKTFGYRWPQLKTLLEQVELVVGLRQHDSAGDVEVVLQTLGYPVRFGCIDVDHEYATSSRVRAEAMHGYLDPQIRQYVRDRRLYKDT